jgi:hypothetical protein
MGGWQGAVSEDGLSQMGRNNATAMGLGEVIAVELGLAISLSILRLWT